MFLEKRVFGGRGGREGEETFLIIERLSEDITEQTGFLHRNINRE